MKLIRKLAIAVVPVLAVFGMALPTVPTALAAPTPTCVVHSNHSMVEMGEFGTASSIADIIQVECQPVFSENYVLIDATQLNNLCHGTLLWTSDSTGPFGGGLGAGPHFTVFLDDDGNATAAVFGGPSCAAGTALISADLLVAPYTTATTHFKINPPHNTTTGVYAVPSSEVEDATFSGVATVIEVEFPSVDAEQYVTISTPQLYGRCALLPHIIFYGPERVFLAGGVGADNVTLQLDNNGNAFVVAIAGPSCASGPSLITADLLTAPYTTLTTTFRISSPRPTI